MNTWLLAATLCFFVIQCSYWLFCLYYIRRIPLEPKISSTEDNLPCSIVICAHNEAENLDDHLGHFLEQHMESFEVIVVNDHSSDDTALILNNFSLRYPHLKVIHMEGLKERGKKKALLTGILAANHETILMSDADCRPGSMQWARKMTNAMDHNHRVVAGYSPFIETSGWVNVFARFENIVTAIQYFGLGRGGMPYMAVGRNVGYRKSVLKDIHYFQSHQHLMAGDDDLTVQQASGHTHMTFMRHPDSFVFTASPTTVNQYIRQKMRHLSVSGYYRPWHQWVLAGFFISWAMFYVTTFIHIGLGNLALALTTLFLRWIFQLSLYKHFCKLFRQSFKIRHLLVFDIIFPFVWGLIAIFSLFKVNKQWK